MIKQKKRVPFRYPLFFSKNTIEILKKTHMSNFKFEKIIKNYISFEG